MVFLGSLIAATAVSKSNLHERIALKVIMLTGTSPRRLMLGFIVTTAFLSMWISNLATVAMMLPIANAALDQLERRQSVSVATNDTGMWFYSYFHHHIQYIKVNDSFDDGHNSIRHDRCW